MPVPMLVYLAALAGGLGAAEVKASSSIITGDDELALLIPIGRGNRRVTVTVETSNDDIEPTEEIPLDVVSDEPYTEENIPVVDVQVPEAPETGDKLAK